MIRYLELREASSEKFWMIEVFENMHVVTDGVVGSKGQRVTEQFDSSDTALACASALVKSKAHQGYVPAARADSPSVSISLVDARKRFGLKQFDPLGFLDYDAVRLFEGATTIRGDVNRKTLADLVFEGNRTSRQELVIVDGDLTIAGSLEIESYYPNVLVLGDLRCEALISMDSFTWVTGNAYIEACYFGHYNDGGAHVGGTTHVPLLFNSDHDSSLTPAKRTVCVNYYGNRDDFFEYRFYSRDLPKLFPADLFEWHSDEDFDFDWWALAKRIRCGQPVFMPGTAPEMLTAAEIRALSR